MQYYLAAWPPQEDEAVDKCQREEFPRFICSNCGKGYYSATDLNHLYDPYCDNCRGELVAYDEYMNRTLRFVIHHA